jgi:hypothetical protein
MSGTVKNVSADSGISAFPSSISDPALPVLVSVIPISEPFII